MSKPTSGCETSLELPERLCEEMCDRERLFAAFAALISFGAGVLVGVLA
jgi:hypothetical protein